MAEKSELGSTYETFPRTTASAKRGLSWSRSRNTSVATVNGDRRSLKTAARHRRRLPRLDWTLRNGSDACRNSGVESASILPLANQQEPRLAGSEFPRRV